MRFVCVGMNYRSTSLEARERFAIARDDVRVFLQALCAHKSVQEAFVVSTCNRIEIYAVGAPGSTGADAISGVHAVCKHERGASLSRKDGAYELVGKAAIEHLFRVGASLDSMVVGEPQILGQLKDAWRDAQEAGSTGALLHRVVERAFKTAKRVRTETEIASGAVSVSFVAVQLAKRIFADFSKCNVLVLGAGEMAELTALHLHENGAKTVTVANRSLPRARELAERYNWKAETLESVPMLLHQADIVVASTGSPRPVLGVGVLRAALEARHFRPVFIVDIAVPRDVEPAAANLDGVYLYNVDDLEELASQNRGEREMEMKAAHCLIDEEVAAFSRWVSTFSVTPTVAALRQKFLDIREAELERSAAILNDVDPEVRTAVERLTMSMVTRMLHGPVSAMKEAAADGKAEGLIAALQESFELPELGLLSGTEEEEEEDSPVSLTQSAEGRISVDGDESTQSKTGPSQ